jgi:hypothetical protein
MLRGRFSPRGMSRGPCMLMHREDLEEAVSTPKARQVTPIYLRDPTRNWVEPVKPIRMKTARDRLLGLMRDLKFHPAHELEALLPDGEWRLALRDLMVQEFICERIENHLRLRARHLGEKAPIISELLAGIDVRLPVEDSSGEVSKKSVVDDEPDFVPDDEEEKAKAGDDLLVLSDPPRDLTLSAMGSVAMTAAVLAKKGSGKTYLAMVLAEEFLSCENIQVPVVIIDPTGAWYGLRALADGTPSSFHILSLGGPNGDLPLGSHDGVKVADIILAIRPHPVILDLSLLATTEQYEVVADVVSRLYAKSMNSPLHLIIDEADEFAPQILGKGSKHQKRSLEHIDRWVRRGRIKGLGTTVITQRTAAIAKSVLSQVDSMWLLNMGEPNDRRAIDGWISRRVTPQQKLDCMSQIPNLPIGTSYFLQGGISPKFRKFKVRRKRTFDSSKTLELSGRSMAVFSRPTEEALEIAREMLGVSSGGGVSEGDEDDVDSDLDGQDEG